MVSLSHHRKSCRGLRFSQSGERLFTVSKDKSLQMVDMNAGTVAQKIKKAHEFVTICIRYLTIKAM